MAALSSYLIRGRGGGFPGVAPAVPCTPMYRSLAAFLHASWRRFQPIHYPPPLRSSLPPLSPIPLNPPRSCGSTPRLRCRSPPGRPSCVAFPRCHRCLPGGGTVFRAISTPSSSSLRSLYPPPCLRLPARTTCVLPTYPALLPPSALGILRPLAPPCAPLPPALAANIACRDEDVGNWTGRVVALWLVAGGSAPRGKSPRRPLAVVGDGISRPWFFHRP